MYMVRSVTAVIAMSLQKYLKRWKKMFWKQTLICVESHAFVIGSEVLLGSYSRIVAIISGFILFAIWKNESNMKRILKNEKKTKKFKLYF